MMKSPISISLAFLAFLLTSLASPLPDIDVQVQNTTTPSLTPRHVPGWCSFHAKVFESCDDSHRRWTTRHQIGIKYLLDAAKNKYPWSERRYYIDEGEVWIGNEDKRRALDEYLVVEKWGNSKVSYRYDSCAWNEFDIKGWKCGWCERGEWKRGDLGCEKRGPKDRMHDMDCFFPC
ncbi:hypothetical protein P154DRAFT_535134 [Amniculicola lignicola CBS 123094]|uniref:Uncharacterized protein n=1 Tax=Amniculicola lignicola CBS 123094 TaxID=1392246 RepID=A0A6A5WE46_9PLEO|nr:hypothetical protein P154DRAFT_535134 [Amniculicola lignicola CBS 123094]